MENGNQSLNAINALSACQVHHVLPNNEFEQVTIQVFSVDSCAEHNIGVNEGAEFMSIDDFNRFRVY